MTSARLRDSGVEWVGSIPDHWVVKRIKHSYRFSKGRNAQQLTAEYLGEHPGSFPVYSGQTENSGVMGTIDGFAYDLPEAVVVTTVGSSKVMTPTLISGRFSLSQNCAMITPIRDNVSLRYLYYQLPALFRYERGSIPEHLQASLRIEDLRRFEAVCPPQAEQVSIASFLDRKTAAIDALIARKERLIELLQEKRQALTTQAVTKGLDPSVPMQDSGVGWLGQIPRHWTVLRLRHACSSIFLGLTSKVDYVSEGGVPLVRALNIAGGTLDFADARNISEEQHRYLTKYRRAQRHDILLSKSGSIGTAAIVETDAQFSIYESIFALRARPGVLTPRFLLAMLRAHTTQAQYMAHLVGMGVTHLNMSDIIDVRIPVPPLAEQPAIAEFVDSASGRILQQVQLLQRSVDRIREYRQALITAAVIGKIDVSNEAA